MTLPGRVDKRVRKASRTSIPILRIRMRAKILRIRMGAKILRIRIRAKTLRIQIRAKILRIRVKWRRGRGQAAFSVASDAVVWQIIRVLE